MISRKRLLNLYDYDASGFLRNRKTGRLVRGSHSSHGYLSFGYRIGPKVFHVQYHRAVWLWHYRYLPKELDHKDRKKKNNRIENLRPTTRSDNMLNVPRRKNVGVYQQGRRFYAMLTIKNKNKYLGSFSSVESARRAVSRARA